MGILEESFGHGYAKSNEMNKHDLCESSEGVDHIPSGEEQSINFFALIVEIVEPMPDTKTSNSVIGQLLRLGIHAFGTETSPVLNYVEELPQECLWQKRRIAQGFYP